MSDTYPPQVPELVHVFDALELRTQLQDALERNRELEGIVQKYAEHSSGRCDFYMVCHCGLNEKLKELGLPEKKLV